MSNGASSHKPRKKRNTSSGIKRDDASTDIVSVDDHTNTAKPEFPLVAFLWPAKGTTSQWLILPVILMIVGLFQWTIGLWGYSGLGKPPMHGDFEAQRHWMEITNHLPASHWYFYDLEYWGLDYPPLTAYHSWLMGKIGSFIDPAWYSLDGSRGLEDGQLKVYMRATVMVSAYLVYVPAAIVFLRRYARDQGVAMPSYAVAMVALFMQPATILIDHGHFQYNAVMLGFVVAWLSSIFAGRLLWSCIFFVAALGYKQMALYYSPIVFAHLLGCCLTPRFLPGRLLAIAMVTSISLAALYAPLLLGAAYDFKRGINLPENPTNTLLLSYFPIKFQPDTLKHQLLLQIAQAIHRIFPFSRGLFEDKVANFWCALNTVYKVHHLQNLIALPRLSLYLTLMSVLAPFLLTCANPRPSLLPYALASSAWSFFLFSFQVHEKSVLLPLLPMTLLLGSRDGLSKEYRAWVGWANMVGAWTLYPLLKRDGLRTPYFVLTLLWAYLLGLPPTSTGIYYGDQDATKHKASVSEDQHQHQRSRKSGLATKTKVLHCAVYAAMVFWHVGEATIEPPRGKPDLWVVLNVCLGAVSFGICYLWCTWKLILETDLLADYFGYRHQQTRRDKRSTTATTTHSTPNKNALKQ